MKLKSNKSFLLTTAISVIVIMLMVLIFLVIFGGGSDGNDHEHSYDRKDTSFTFLASEADCENSAQYYYSCSCGEKGTETFSYGKPEEHEYSSEWTHDEDAHWHATVCSHEGRADISAHDWNDGKVTKNPTETEEGEKVYKCVVCNTEKSETIPVIIHTHTYEDAWSSDEDIHWHASTCDHDVKSGVSVHSWDGGTVVTASTEEKEGEMLYKCIVCNAESLRSIPKLVHTHTYNDEWSSDDYVHWHAASCGHNVKADVAVHIWNDGETVTAPTEQSEGEIKYTCVLCGKQKTQKVPALTHTHTYGDEWSSDEYLHWHAATCEHNDKADIAAHIWSSGVVTPPATDGADEVITYKCVVCNYTRTESIPKAEHTHTYEDKWSSDDAGHWHAASCGHNVKADVAVHIWNDGETVTAPTEQSEGVIKYTCLVCNKEKTKTVPALTHTHTYSDEWTSNEYFHWHKATCDHADNKSDVAAHTWSSGVVTEPATEEKDGILTYKCADCEYTKTEIIPKLVHTHTYSDEWSSDDASHWHAATCGHSVKSDVAAHIWNNGEVAKAPTESADGEVKYTCVTCGKEKTEILPKLVHTHTYSDEWTSDEYLHWYASTCEHNNKANIAAHIWSSGVVTEPAAEGKDGILTYKCAVCGYIKTEIIPKLEHVHTYDDKRSSDDDTHWYAATCGHDVKADVSAHTWDSGTVITEAAEDKEGEIIYKCSICKKEKSVVIPMLEHEHTYKKEWSSDPYIHWHETTCNHDEKIDISAHIWGESIVRIPATEESTGELLFTCVICEAQKVEEIPKLEHFHTYADTWSYNDDSHWRVATCQHTAEIIGESEHLWNNGVITTPPSDQTAGVKTYTCVVCEHTKTEIIPVVGHVHSFTVKNTNYLHTAADCTHKATYYYSCACGEKGDALFEYGEVSAHKYINYISDGNATCAADGTKTAKCENCDSTNTISDIGSITPHPYAEEWTTDENYHWHIATCSHTDMLYGMGSHNWNEGEVTLAPTESATGIMTYTCVDCSRTRTETIPELGHVHNFNVKSDAHIASLATCRSKATYYYICECGVVGTSTYEFGSFGGHSFVDYVYDGNATCSADGTKTAICSIDGCGETDTVEAEGTKLAHSFSGSWSSDDNYHWHDATCGHTDQISAKEEHQWNAGVTVTEPTETEEGTKRFTCVVCGTTKVEAIPKINHTHTFNVKTNKYLESAASCTSKAKYFYTCVCGAVGDATYEYGSLIHHSYEDYVSDNNATCGADGTKTRTCDICGNTDTKTDVGTKLPHTYSDTWTYDDNQHWHAGICEHTDARADVQDHAWDIGVVTLEPTETTDGSKLHTCTTCNATKVVVIPHLDHVHTYEEGWSYNADKHWHAATCSHANEKLGEEAHSFVLDAEGSSNATIYEEGYALYKCSVCGYEKEVVVSKLPAFTVIFYDSRYNVISEKNYAVGTGEIVVPTAPAKTGYRFVEWVNASNDDTLDSIVFANAPENTVFIFNPVYLKEHTVTFVDHNNNVIGTVTVLDGQCIDASLLPAIPERVGYSAVWDSEVTTSIVTENTVIAPVYNVLTYEVTFIDKDGNPLSYVDERGNTVVVQSVNHGSFAMAPEHPQYWFDQTTLKLYEFTGWSVDIENITESYIGAGAIRALYEKEVDRPVIAIKISGNTAKISITLPDGAELYSLKFSAKWNNNNGLCGITLAQLENISSLNKDACGETLCTVGDKNGESGWLTYNNKNYTFDFLWTCGNGHALRAENVFTLTFESPSPSFVLDESIFEILSTSSIIYGSADADITELEKVDVFVWFYE